MLMRLLQVLAFQGTRKRNFALGPATDVADISAHGRAIAARAALSANLTQNRLYHSLTVIIGSGTMKRVDLYVKVTVDLEEEENPERVAGEICRQIEKMYVVRSAELSSIVARD
jgi:hypothetical protein